MNKILIVGSILAIACLAGCGAATPLESMRRCPWRNGTNHLTQVQIDGIVVALQGNLIEPKESPVPPKLGGVPIAAAPDLCVYIEGAHGRFGAQLLGFNKDWLVLDSRYVVTDSNTVNQVYRIVEEKLSRTRP